MDELTDFERRLADALVRQAGPRRPVDAMGVAVRARTGTTPKRPGRIRRLIDRSQADTAPRSGRSSHRRWDGHRRVVPPTAIAAGSADPSRGERRGADRIRPDQPQARVAGVLNGFDIDVATELGRRLGLKVEIQPVEPARLLDDDQAKALDILLPSVTTSAIDLARFARSVPYYWWPHFLVVTVASGRTDPGDLAGQTICAVAGDAGESWLRGAGGNPPIDGSTVLSRATDQECLAALTDGSATGMVTARMGPADLAARPSLAVLAGPPAEPRAVVGALELQPGSLMVEVDQAITQMLDDGTLSNLSKNRFGGYDLSRPPAE